MLKGFRDFVLRGNVMDLAVAVIIGAAFTAIVTALTTNIISPLLGAIVGKPNFDYLLAHINGGAIALGHPLGCTGCKLTVQLVQDMKRLNKKYGIVTACVGGGQGIAGIIENLN